MMKRIVSILLVLVMLLTLMPATIAEGGQNSEFEISGNRLIRYNGSSSSVTVPAEVEVIGSNAFLNNRTITSVRFEGKVTTIQSKAFSGCINLSRVSFADISELETIGAYAFEGCQKLSSSWASEVENVSSTAFASSSSSSKFASTATNTPAPTVEPTADPVVEPTAEPVVEPTDEPIVEPTAEPIVESTAEPIVEPTAEPIVEPTAEPVVEPTDEPIVEPIVEPTAEPIVEPIVEPTAEPIVEPTELPITNYKEEEASPSDNAMDYSEETDYEEEEAIELPLIANDTQLFMSSREDAIVITSQPVDYIGVIGETAAFDVVAEGNGLTYSWRYSTDGGSTWKYMGGASVATPNLRIAVTEARIGYCYRCVITDSDGNKVVSDTAKIVANLINITSQPTDYVGSIGDTAEFDVVAVGNGLTYSWRYSTDDGTTWKYMGGASVVTPNLRIAITEARNGYCYRCVITDTNGNQVTSNTAKIIIEDDEPICITQQPADFVGVVGETAAFDIVAEGDGLTYSWRYSTDNGSTWKYMGGASVTTPNLRITITEARDGYCYRCVITDADGNRITSETAKIVVDLDEKINITSQPVDYVGFVGETATFNVIAEGKGLTYSWRYSTDDGATWKYMGGASVVTPNLQIAITEARNGYSYRCVITDSNGNKVTSATAKIIVDVPNSISITTQPVDYIGSVGETASFLVIAEGDGLTYSWRYSTDGGSTWKYMGGASVITSNLQISITQARNGYCYRCKITDENGNFVYTDTVQLKIGTPEVHISISSQPESISDAILYSVANFNIIAEGNELTYIWQYSTDGTSWYDSSVDSASTSSLKVEVTEDINQNLYRCLIIDNEGHFVYTDTVQLSAKLDQFILDEIIYSIINDTQAQVIDYIGDASSLTVPSVARGYSVIRIHDSAFEGNTTLTSIDLPDTIQTIGVRAFANCTNLSTIE